LRAWSFARSSWPKREAPGAVPKGSWRPGRAAVLWSGAFLNRDGSENLVAAFGYLHRGNSGEYAARDNPVSNESITSSKHLLAERIMLGNRSFLRRIRKS
jgi:hypothetical protein